MSAFFLYARARAHTDRIEYTLSRTQAWGWFGVAGNSPVTAFCKQATRNFTHLPLCTRAEMAIMNPNVLTMTS